MIPGANVTDDEASLEKWLFTQLKDLQSGSGKSYTQSQAWKWSLGIAHQSSHCSAEDEERQMGIFRREH